MGEFGRISVHHALGGGAVADLLLWKNVSSGVRLLIASTTFWFLFEKAGYNFLSFVTNVLFLLVVTLFLWAKSASILNRPMPPLPDLEISEETVLVAADQTRVWVNRVLLTACEIASGGDLKLSIKLIVVFWVISYVGSFFNFLTLVYIGVLLSLSIPFLYDTYQAEVDEKLVVLHNGIQELYRKLDDLVLVKIPMPQNKKKKSQ